jgi:hypothetical protein
MAQKNLISATLGSNIYKHLKCAIGVGGGAIVGVSFSISVYRK